MVNKMFGVNVNPDVICPSFLGKYRGVKRDGYICAGV